MAKGKIRRKKSFTFLIVINSFVLIFAVVTIVILMIANLYWMIFIYLKLLYDKGVLALYVTFYVMSAIVIITATMAFIAACTRKYIILKVYSIIAIVVCCVLFVLMVAWIVVTSMFIDKLDKNLEKRFQEYNGEFDRGDASVAFNFMFVQFKTCGIDGADGFANGPFVPQWTHLNDSNFPWPVTCCDGVHGVIDAKKILDKTFSPDDLGKPEHQDIYDNCTKNAYDKGTEKLLKDFFNAILIGVAALSVVVIALLVMGVIAACRLINK